MGETRRHEYPREEGGACVTTVKGLSNNGILASLPRCWDLDNSSPYWWIIKGPIVLSVGVSPWASVLRFIQSTSLELPRGCAQQEMQLQAGCLEDWTPASLCH